MVGPQRRDGCSFLQPEQNGLILARILNHEAFIEYGNVDVQLLIHSMVIIKYRHSSLEEEACQVS